MSNDQMYGDPIDSWRNAVKKLEAENKRLREALREIAERAKSDHSLFRCCCPSCLAIKALEQRPGGEGR